jgi:hypothetical protein
MHEVENIGVWNANASLVVELRKEIVDVVVHSTYPVLPLPRNPLL